MLFDFFSSGSPQGSLLLKVTTLVMLYIYLYILYSNGTFYSELLPEESLDNLGTLRAAAKTPKRKEFTNLIEVLPYQDIYEEIRSRLLS